MSGRRTPARRCPYSSDRSADLVATPRVLALTQPLAPQWIPLQRRRASHQDVPMQSAGTSGSGPFDECLPARVPVSLGTLQARRQRRHGPPRDGGTCRRQRSAGQARLLCCLRSAQEGFRGNRTTFSGPTPPEVAAQEPSGEAKPGSAAGHTAQGPVPIRFAALTLDGRSPRIVGPASPFPRSGNFPFPVRCLFIEKRSQRC